MSRSINAVVLCSSFIICLSLGMGADERADIFRYGQDLEQAATDLALDSFEAFEGRDGAISDREQAALFKSEAFAAYCRLFLKLESHEDVAQRLDIAGRLKRAREQLARVRTLDYLASLRGTIGADPLGPARSGSGRAGGEVATAA